MKLLILGACASGKTTFIKYLQSNRSNLALENILITELDEQILVENGNIWPSDDKYKDKVIIPEIITKILNLDKVIFAFQDIENEDNCLKFKNKGFRIIALKTDLDLLLERNQFRMKNNNYPDLSMWMPEQVNAINELIEKKLVDAVIDMNKNPTMDEIYKQIF